MEKCFYEKCFSEIATDQTGNGRARGQRRAGGEEERGREGIRAGSECCAHVGWLPAKRLRFPSARVPPRPGGWGGAPVARGTRQPRRLPERATTAAMPRAKRLMRPQSCASAVRTRGRSWWLPFRTGPPPALRSQHSRAMPDPAHRLGGKTGRAQAVAGIRSRTHIWRTTTRRLSLCLSFVSWFRKHARWPTAD